MGKDDDYGSLKNPPSQYVNKQSTNPQQNPSGGNDLKTRCFAPSDLFGGEFASIFGNHIEPWLGVFLYSYLIKYGVSWWDLYIDPSNESKSYLGFLKQKNPAIINKFPDSVLTERRPDILIDNGSSKREYYEIKPNSGSGRSDGKKKINKLNEIYVRISKVTGHTYQAGGNFNPPLKTDIGSVNIKIEGVSIPVSVSLRFDKEDALILYSICIKTDWKKVHLSKKEIELLKAIWKIIKDFLKKVIDSVKTLELVTAAAFALMFDRYLQDSKPISSAVILGIAFVLFLLSAEITIPSFLIAAIIEAFKEAVLIAAG